MVKPELGTKRVCVSCGARFYDLTKSPAVCPKCGTEQPVEQPRVRRSGGNVAEEKRIKKPPVADDQDTDVEEADDTAEEDEEGAEGGESLDDEPDAIGDEIEIEPEEN